MQAVPCLYCRAEQGKLTEKAKNVLIGYWIDKLTHDDPYGAPAAFISNVIEEFSFQSLAHLVNHCGFEVKPIKESAVENLVQNHHRVINVKNEYCIILQENETWGSINLDDDDIDKTVILEEDDLLTIGAALENENDIDNDDNNNDNANDGIENSNVNDHRSNDNTVQTSRKLKNEFDDSDDVDLDANQLA